MSPAKKTKVQVVADAIQLNDGAWHYNGEQFSVTEAQAKKLLASGAVIKVK